MIYDTTNEYALNADKNDKLNDYRNKFFIPLKDGKKILYFTGNSLGLMPIAAKEAVEQELNDWAKYGVDGHMQAANPWLAYHEYLAVNMAEVIGALPSEVVVMNSLTVNLHFLFISFYRPLKDKNKIFIEPSSFPSDYYAVESHIKLHGYDPAEALLEAPLDEEQHIVNTDNIIEMIEKKGNEINLLWFSGVNYYTGQAFDIKKITEAAHKKGIIAGFDLAHAAGNLLLKLHDWNVDFAVWCNYKYMNGGPGAVGGIFVHENHHKTVLPLFAGWWGHDKSTRFKMEHKFVPIPTAEKWQVSNPPIFQLAALKASLDIFHEVGMVNLREKSVMLTGYLEYLINNIMPDKISIITPSDPSQRGCQLSLKLEKNGLEIFNKLEGYGISCDWREPDVIRCAPVPLYNKFSDVYNFISILNNLIG